MRFLQITVLLIFLASVGAFAVQNNDLTSVRFLVWQLSAPLSLLIVIVYLFGMISGGAVVGFLRRSIRRVSEHPQAN
ncbi:lipopolysaccharide assembly protein LapA domain-containing protein [Tundrisphaera lichenicola]|uniref:lipopolysaccharide assembly protein LapA domain-containing protein n=1 Tax=Tundrisphaera lichenicola TaxID=2029860 RepID=UPI003EBA656D